MNKTFGLLYGAEIQLLDHIAPFCSLHKIPLIVTEKEYLRICEKFYPNTQVKHYSYAKLPYETLQQFDTVISCHWSCVLDEVFCLANQIQNKRLKTIWLPHGHSDKGYNSYLKPLLSDELHIYVYGKKMVDHLKELQSCTLYPLGNFRLHYHKAQSQLYNTLGLINSKPTILFAPTWFSSEEKTKYFAFFKRLIKQVPNKYHIFVKLHPRTIHEFSYEYENLQHCCPQAQYLHALTSIYPILEASNIYIGDTSSIGYDFLHYKRPMLFLEMDKNKNSSDPERVLHNCGIPFYADEIETLPQLLQDSIERNQEFDTLKEQLYQYTFSDRGDKIVT